MDDGHSTLSAGCIQRGRKRRGFSHHSGWQEEPEQSKEVDRYQVYLEIGKENRSVCGRLDEATARR